MTLASITAQYVVLVPTAAASVPPGCMFLDASNGNQPTIKGTNSSSEAIQTAGSATGMNYFLKVMLAFGPIAANRPLSKGADGYVRDAEANAAANDQTFCGYSTNPSVNQGDPITVILPGPNLGNALVGLNFKTGDEIYLSDATGYTNDSSTLSASIDSIIKLGVADCGAGTASSIATDLIGFTSVIARV